MIEQCFLKSILLYNQETGEFKWKERNNQSSNSCFNSRFAGKIAGTKCTNQSGKTYIKIKINKKIISAHRLAFIYMGEKLPIEVDHIDGDGTNNRWANLRPANRTKNQRNRKRNKNNKTGLSGVVWNNQANKWQATMRNNGKSIHLGFFALKEDAINARIKANKQHGFSDTHGSR